MSIDIANEAYFGEKKFINFRTLQSSKRIYSEVTSDLTKFESSTSYVGTDLSTS